VQTIEIEVKDGANGFKVLLTIERIPRQHAGWESVRWQGKRYQVFGGIRNPYFIDIANPLKKTHVLV
jgi:hypothetical protein